MGMADKQTIEPQALARETIPWAPALDGFWPGEAQRTLEAILRVQIDGRSSHERLEASMQFDGDLRKTALADAHSIAAMPADEFRSWCPTTGAGPDTDRLAHLASAENLRAAVMGIIRKKIAAAG